MEGTNIFICESSLHIAEAVCIAEENFDDSRNILVVTNAPRVPSMNADILDEAFDRHFVGNYKLNISSKALPLVPDSIQSGINRALSYVALLSMITVLACVSALTLRLNVFFATRSPVLNNGLAWIRNGGGARLYHFEEGISLYMEKGLKDRSRLSEFLFPLTLETMITDGIIDGVYCMRPDDLGDIYPGMETREIKFFAHVELVTALFVTDLNTDRIPLDRPLFVLVTQPLVENEYISVEAYREKTTDLMTALSETHHVLVKPHPGEDSTRYEDLVTDTDVTVLSEAEYPVELFIWSLIGHDDVSHVSVGSTALSTALSNLATVPVEKYSFVKYYGLDEMDEKMRRYYAGCSIEYVSDPKAAFGTGGRFAPDSGSRPP